MTLYDLMSTITLQGNIEVRVMDGNGNEVDKESFHGTSDLECSGLTRLERMEDFNVEYMFVLGNIMIIELKQDDPAEREKVINAFNALY